RRPTKPHVDGTTRQCGVYVVEAMNEGQLAVHRDVQVTNLIAEGATKCSEGFLPGSTFTVSPEASQGRSEIEGNEIGCIEGHDAVDVLRAKRLQPIFYALTNEGFSRRKIDACFHDVSLLRTAYSGRILRCLRHADNATRLHRVTAWFFSTHYRASGDFSHFPATWRVLTLRRFQTLIVPMPRSSPANACSS